METKNNSRRVKILRESVARKIAAGEVIDRPYSIVRELLDNAIDARSTQIDLYIENGGIGRIRIIDNGCGMTKEDLELCILPYATSKIDSENDLYSLSTLGFRGEALSSIAACARLEIISRTEDNEAAYKMQVSGNKGKLSPFRGEKGTIIDTSDLFFSIPARKHFLKSPAAETGLCTRIFIDKSLPFCSISFRLYTDGKLKMFLPPSNLKERVLNAYKGKFNQKFLFEQEREWEHFKMTVIAGSPELARGDRRYIQIFVNNRRIEEYSLIQAAQYGYSEVLPGGVFPVVFIFLTVDPALVDFNIHPAKKEARFRNLPEIHHGIVELLKSFIDKNFMKPQENIIADKLGFSRDSSQENNKQASYSQPNIHSDFDRPGASLSVHKNILRPPSLDSITDFARMVGEAENKYQPENKIINEKKENPQETKGRYLGQIMNLFLLYEKDDKLYIIDQHAAHERILFNHLTSGEKGNQQLLIPVPLDIDGDKKALIEENIDSYKKMGISLTKTEKQEWELSSIPAVLSGHASWIIEALQEQKGNSKTLQVELFANIACKAAIKDGAVLDSLTAEKLAKETFALPEPRCPHGRPVWTVISRGDLYKLMGRIV